MKGVNLVLFVGQFDWSPIPVFWYCKWAGGTEYRLSIDDSTSSHLCWITGPTNERSNHFAMLRTNSISVFSKKLFSWLLAYFGNASHVLYMLDFFLNFFRLASCLQRQDLFPSEYECIIQLGMRITWSSKFWRTIA